MAQKSEINGIRGCKVPVSINQYLTAILLSSKCSSLYQQNGPELHLLESNPRKSETEKLQERLSKVKEKYTGDL